MTSLLANYVLKILLLDCFVEISTKLQCHLCVFLFFWSVRAVLESSYQFNGVLQPWSYSLFKQRLITVLPVFWSACKNYFRLHGFPWLALNNKHIYITNLWHVSLTQVSLNASFGQEIIYFVILLLWRCPVLDIYGWAEFTGFEHGY